MAIFRLVFVGMAAILLSGCTTPVYRYAAIPPNLLPPPAELPVILSTELQCLSDDTYIKLVRRDQSRAQEIKELRALLSDQ